MRHYVFIVHRSVRETMVVSWSKDLIAAVKFFKKYQPFEIGNESNLVFVEYANDEDEAVSRFNYITTLPKEMKLELIKTQNPDMITIIPGVNIDL